MYVSKEYILLLFGLFVIFFVVTLFNSVNHELNNLDQYKGLFYILVPVFLILYSSGLDRNAVALALMIGCLIAVVFGYYRFITGDAGLVTEHALGYWGIRYTQASRNSDVLYPLVLLVLSVSLHAGTKKYYLKIIYTFLSIIGCVALILSYSRGAWIAAFVACLLLMANKKSTALLYVGVISTVLFSFILLVKMIGDNQPDVLNDVITRFMSIFDWEKQEVSSNLGRLVLIKLTLQEIISHPLGVGAQNFKLAFGGDFIAGNAENAYLNIALEGGIMALVIFVVINLKLINKSAHIAKYGVGGGQISPQHGKLALSLIVAMDLYFIFNYEANSIFVWAVIGCVLLFCFPKRT